MTEDRNLRDEIVAKYADLVGEIEATELKEVRCGSLSVVVDFNELYHDEGEERSFDLIGKLKDLLE